MYNIYFRTINKNITNDYWALDYPDTTTPTHAVCRNVFNNTDEVFVLFPKIYFTNPAEQINVVPTNFNRNLSFFRVSNTSYFGSINSLIAQSLDLRMKFIHLTERTSTNADPAIDCRNTGGWGDVGWSVLFPSTFRNQIATYVAECAQLSNSPYLNWNVYIFPDSVTVSSSNYTFVIFYPGSDSAHQHLISVDT